MVIRIICFYIMYVMSSCTYGVLRSIRSGLPSLQLLGRQSPCVSTTELPSSWKHSLCLVQITQRISLSSNGSPPPPSPESVVLYRWPTMKHFRFISRFKVYQVSIMTLLLPPIGYMYLHGDITAKMMGYASFAAVGMTAVLLVLSHYFRRVVGEIVYIKSCDQEQLTVSTLTFAGGRRNLKFNVEDIIPFSDSQLRMGGAIQRLEFTNHPEVFLYSLKYGRVLDFDLLQKCLKL